MANQDMDGFGRFLRVADRVMLPIEYGLNLFGGILVFLLMILGMAQIILRTVFKTPIFGYIDIVEVAMVGFAVLGISYVQRVGGHVRMEIVVGRLKGRALWVVESFGVLVAIIIIAILIPYSYEHFGRAFSIGDSTIDIELPTWPAKLAVPIALGILLLRLFIQFLGYLRLVVLPNAEPIAVPHLKTVEELAAEEIETVN